MQMTMKTDDPFWPQLKEMLAAGDKAAQLTKGLLLFSRKQTLELKPVNINELIDGFKKMLGRIIGEDIEFRIKTSDEDLTVMADRGHIEQVLMNLAANARDAMHKGGMLSIETKNVRIGRRFVTAHGYGEPGKYGLISVSDSGTGMDEKTRERIFEPYFTTKGIGSGTGLGLSIVFGIVKQHKGYIHCYSELGRGTTFKIYMPFVKVEGIELEDLEAATPKGGTETVLVAEDDPALRNLTKTMLESFGYTVIEAVDGEDAINKFKENKDRIQLLIFDVIMPRENGRDAYEDIKGISHDIKAVFMSGYSADIIQSKGMLEDGMEFISKPVLPNELLRKVRDVLDR
jgi:CheY-like chemotaxis protein